MRFEPWTPDPWCPQQPTNPQAGITIAKLPKQAKNMGRGGGQMVSVLAFYSDDPSSNPTEAYSFSVQFVF